MERQGSVSLSELVDGQSIKSFIKDQLNDIKGNITYAETNYISHNSSIYIDHDGAQNKNMAKNTVKLIIRKIEKVSYLLVHEVI